MLFDRADVYLLLFDNSPAGGLVSARKFGWATPGSFVVLFDFLQSPASLTPNWLRVLRAACIRFGCRVLRFLGHGGMGRVFRVGTGDCESPSDHALKVVEAGPSSPGA